MKKAIAIICLGIAAFTGSLAQAQAQAQAQSLEGIGLGVGLSSMGTTIEASYKIRERIALRGIMNLGAKATDQALTDALEALSGDVSTTTGSIWEQFGFSDSPVDINAKLGGTALLADFYSKRSVFYASAGAFFSNTEVKVTARDTTISTGIGTPIANPYADIEGTVKFKRGIAPMLISGMRLGLKRGPAISVEAGAILSPFEASTNSTDSAVQNDIQELNDVLDAIGVYPWISIGLNYRF